MDEHAYSAGQRALAASLLSTLLPYLGGDMDAEAWRLERAAAIAALQQYGEVDDNLYLSDAIEQVCGSDLLDRLQALTAAQRLDLFENFCRSCGSADLPCYCTRDD